MTRRRRAARALGAVAAGLVLAAGGPSPSAPAAAPPAPVRPPTQAPADAITFEGVDQTPWVTREGDWNVVLDVRGAPPGSTIEGRLGARFEGTEELYDSYFGIVGDDRLASIPGIDLDSVPADGTGRREVSLAVSLRQDQPSRPGWAFLSAGLRPGVYPVVVTVVGPDGTELAETLVLLTRVPSGDEAGADDPPVLVAPLIELHDDPSVTVDGADTTGMDLIARTVALAEGLERAPGFPATLVPRPETVESLARQPAGREALEDLAAQARTRQVVDGPYVDVPLTTWVARGMDDELTRQRERGNRILTEHFGRVDSSVWSAPGGVDPDTAAALWDVGVRTVLLGAAAVGHERVEGPVAVATGAAGPLDGVVVDAGLSDAVVRRGDPVLDAAGLAAELALVATEAEGQVAMALAPPLEWAADPEAITRLAEVLGHEAAPVEPVTVAELLERAPEATARETAAARPDIGDHPQRLEAARRALASYASMAGPGSEEVGALDQRLLLSGASALTDDQRRAYVASVADTVDARFAAVEAPTRQTITLTSSDGDVPLTLRNGLDHPVQVRIRLDTDSRVDLPQGDDMVVDLAPGTNRIPVPVHTRLPGDSPIDITVRSPDGAVVLDEVEYTVRSTALSGIGVFLSVGAAAFLLLWWFRHWRRTHHLRRAAEAGAEARARIAATDHDVPTAT